MTYAPQGPRNYVCMYVIYLMPTDLASSSLLTFMFSNMSLHLIVFCMCFYFIWFYRYFLTYIAFFLHFFLIGCVLLLCVRPCVREENVFVLTLSMLWDAPSLIFPDFQSFGSLNNKFPHPVDRVRFYLVSTTVSVEANL